MKEHDPIVIVGAARTPMGAMQGSLAALSVTSLGAEAIKAAVKRASAGPDDIQEVLMGCVLAAGVGQAPARQAAIGAGLPVDVGCTTINKMCGSGMKAVMLAHDILVSSGCEMMVAGGMESMSNAPYLLPKARSGYRLGHGELKDHMFYDGLEDAYQSGVLMGRFADDTARTYNFSRQQQDEFAILSLERAQRAIANNLFAKEIVPVLIKNRNGTNEVSVDEIPGKAKLAKIPQLKPAFSKDGTVTAANASSIADGAAAVVLMPWSIAKRRGFVPLAKIVGHASHAQEPEWFTTAPVGAIKKLLQQVNWHAHQVDLYEINEAFAVVTMAAMHDLSLPSDIVNINGGACALGHPIGATGVRIIVTLLAAMAHRQVKRGIASLCIGGGEATAIALERLD